MLRIKYFFSVKKNANLMLLETLRRVMTGQFILWLLTRSENNFETDLGKVFHLPEFQAKLFWVRN